jgi:hypothetical protein
MGKISPGDFIGTRVRFQRLTDARLFNGWLDDFRGSMLTVQTVDDLTDDVGARFNFEAFGLGVTAVFEAKLALVAQRPVHTAGVEGALALSQAPGWTTLHFRVEGSLRCVTSEESFRIRVQEMVATLVTPHGEEQVRLIDVGPKGFGAVTSQPYEPGSLVGFLVQTASGRIVGQAEVRYCRESAGQDGPYRIGVQLARMPRLDGPRWDRFVRELA